METMITITRQFQVIVKVGSQPYKVVAKAQDAKNALIAALEYDLKNFLVKGGE